MKHSIIKYSVWYGVALLWRPGGSLLPHARASADSFSASLSKSNEGGSIPPLHTNFKYQVGAHLIYMGSLREGLSVGRLGRGTKPNNSNIMLDLSTKPTHSS
jgi:hypothetical protein